MSLQCFAHFDWALLRDYFSSPDEKVDFRYTLKKIYIIQGLQCRLLLGQKYVGVSDAAVLFYCLPHFMMTPMIYVQHENELSIYAAN